MDIFFFLFSFLFLAFDLSRVRMTSPRSPARVYPNAQAFAMHIMLHWFVRLLVRWLTRSFAHSLALGTFCGYLQCLSKVANQEFQALLAGSMDGSFSFFCFFLAFNLSLGLS